jgi:hypothetical protein
MIDLSAINEDSTSPRMPKRQSSFRRRREEEEEDDFEVDVFLRSPPSRELTGMRHESYSFLSYSMSSMQLDDCFSQSMNNLDGARSRRSSHFNGSPGLESPKLSSETRRRGLRRSNGMMMPSPSRQTPRGLQRARSNFKGFRAMELPSIDLDCAC